MELRLRAAGSHEKCILIDLETDLLPFSCHNALIALKSALPKMWPDSNHFVFMSMFFWFLFPYHCRFGAYIGLVLIDAGSDGGQCVGTGEFIGHEILRWFVERLHQPLVKECFFVYWRGVGIEHSDAWYKKFSIEAVSITISLVLGRTF